MRYGKGQKTKILVLFFLIVSVLKTPICFSQEKPDIDFLYAALQTQENLRGPALKVKFSILGGPKHETLIFESEYIKTSEYAFLEDRNFWNKELLSIKKTRHERSFGILKEFSITLKSGSKFGSVESSYDFPILPRSLILETVNIGIGIDGRTIPLLDVLKKRKADSPGITKNIDGYKCWLIKTGNARTYTEIWLGEEIGFNPVLIRRFVNSELRSERHFWEYKEIIKGFWFPMRCLSKSSQKESSGNLLQVTDISVGKPISEEETKVEFPPGTVVTDFLIGTTFTVPEK